MNRTTRWCAGAALALALVPLAACGSTSDTSTEPSSSAPATSGTSAPAAAEVTVDDPWARTSPMAVTLGAVYMTLESNVGDVLLRAEVPTSVAGTTEIHETVMSSTTGTSMSDSSADDTGMADPSGTTMPGGMDPSGTMPSSGEMAMRPIDSLELPAGEAVALEPGGYHIMLIDLVAPLEAGSTIDVTLTFEKAGEQVVTATVRDS